MLNLGIKNVEAGGAQAFDQAFLHLNPDGMDQAFFLESAGFTGPNTFVKQDRTIDRFDDIQYGYFLGFAGKRNTAASAA
jgi:hypothetical protein